MPTFTNKAYQSVNICGGCGKVVSCLDHPTAVSNVFDKDSSIIACPGCGARFIRCAACGGQDAAFRELALHQTDARVSPACRGGKQK